MLYLYLQGNYWLVANLLYGSGLRLLESLSLRVKDINKGFGEVELPYALQKKYPNVGKEFIWQWIFPASRSRTR